MALTEVNPSYEPTGAALRRYVDAVAGTFAAARMGVRAGREWPIGAGLRWRRGLDRRSAADRPGGSIVGMVELREATPADALDIATVHVESWQVGYRGLIPDDVLAGLSVESREQRRRQTLSVPGLRGTLVAVQDTAVLGFVSVGADREGDPTCGELYAIYLRPTSWRRAWAARCTPRRWPGCGRSATTGPACGCSPATSVRCASTGAWAGRRTVAGRSSTVPAGYAWTTAGWAGGWRRS